MLAAFDTFIGEPLRRRRADLAWYRLSQLLHERTNGAFDAAYMRLARGMRPKVDLPAPSQMTAGQIAETVSRLRGEGYAPMPIRLAAEDIDAIRSFAFTTPAHGADITHDLAITPDNIPVGEPRYNWWMHDLARLKVIRRLIEQGPYCAIAQEYLRCRPILAHIALFLDCPFEGPYTPLIYHYDNEGPGFLKFFFYLTDVDVETGAHHFILGSHGHSKPAQFARATSYDDGSLLAHYGRERELIATGTAGTIFAEDTAGFHRGSPLLHGYRLVLQLEFSVLDVPTGYELARDLVPIEIAGLHPGIARIASKFYKRRA